MKKTKLTEFERDSIWMSYRYCIGRHSIAAHQRAGDIWKFLQTKDVSDSELEGTAVDIRDQIAYIIESCYDFHMTFHHESELHNPYNLFMQYCIDTHVTDINMIGDRDPVEVDHDFKGDLKYVYKHASHRYDNRCYYWHWVEDLKVWSDLANWFDKRSHKDYVCKNGEVIRGFESYIIRPTVENEATIEKVMIPIDSWDGSQNIYVSFEDIDDVVKLNK